MDMYTDFKILSYFVAIRKKESEEGWKQERKKERKKESFNASICEEY
jgi:hypothetical protein